MNNDTIKTEQACAFTEAYYKLTRGQIGTQDFWELAQAAALRESAPAPHTFEDWYTSISIEGDMQHNMRRAWDASLSRSNAAQSELTDEESARYEALEREHFGDPDKRTGIYAAQPVGHVVDTDHGESIIDCRLEVGTAVYAAPVPQPAREDVQDLMKFYDVSTPKALIEAQKRHIEKLQEKLHAATPPQAAFTKVREG